MDFRKPIRKKLTITSNIVKALNVLKPNDKLIAIDALLNHFFFGDNLFSEEYSDAVVMFLACSAPEIRSIESKYENGKQPKNKN